VSRVVAPTLALAIMAKAPRPGAAKTRLCPPLSPGEAADLARCFLMDKITQVRSLTGVSPAIAFTPWADRSLFEGLAPGFALIPQNGGDLGTRLQWVLGTLLRQGHAAAFAIDADTPTLPVPFLQRGVELASADETDVVLGPTEDGGYYLIGVKAARPELFEGIPWSTPAVLGVTLQRARAAGLRVTSLPCWFDVDTPADLDRLRTTLAAQPIGAATETQRFFRARCAGGSTPEGGC
jgi:uncharacterized protein